MNKKVGVIFSLVFLICSVNFVMAAMEGNNGVYEVEVYLEKGWNLIAGTVPEDGILDGSDIQLSNIKAMWYYSPLQKKYLQVHPDTDWSNLQKDDDDFVLTTAMWIYSDKSGWFKYSTLEDYPNERKLYSGWNFVSITPDFKMQKLSQIKGNCNIEKVVYWDSQEGEYIIFSAGESIDVEGNPTNFEDLILADSDADAGIGMIFKVSNDCNLFGTSSSATASPPSLPSEIDSPSENDETGYLITAGIGDFKFEDSKTFGDDYKLSSCELFEFDGGEDLLLDGDGCVYVLGSYSYSGADTDINVIVEKHLYAISNDAFDGVAGWISESGFGGTYSTESVNSNSVITMSNRDTGDSAILWRSEGHYIVMILFGNFDDATIHESDLIEPYLDKYSSNLNI